MAVELAAGYVSIVPSTAGFAGALGQQISGPVAAQGTASGSLFSSGFAKSLAGVGVAATAAAGAVGVGLFKLGQSFDDAYDTIRVGTGATGRALTDLETSFKNVVKSVPTDFGTASTAITEINQRLGLTGGALEASSTRFLNLARITGGDVSTSIESITRVFGDWGITADDQAERMDQLFRASQATGVGIDTLAQQVVQFGAPLRGMGFGFEESAALLGSFNKAGVNSELVMGSMRIALGKFAREGVTDTKTALVDLMGRIKDAGSSGEAAAISMEYFGARAGADMADTIRGGKFSIAELVDTIANGKDTINGAAADTADFGEKWTVIKNRILVGLEPLAMRVFDGVGAAMDSLGPIIDDVLLGVTAFGAAFGGDGVSSDGLVGGFERAGVAARSFTDWLTGTLWPAVQTVVEAVGGWDTVLIAVGISIAALLSPLGTLAAGVIYAYTEFDGFKAVVDTVIAFFQTTVMPAVTTFAAYLVEQFRNLSEWTQTHWAAIEEAVGHVIAAVQFVIDTFVSYISMLWRTFGDELLNIAGLVWDQISLIVTTAVDLVRGVIEVALALINGNWGEAWEAIKGILATAWEFITGYVGNALQIVGQLVEGALSGLRTLWDIAWDAIKAALSAAWEAMISALSSYIGMVIDFWRNLPGRVIDALGDIAGKMLDVGRQFMEGIATALGVYFWKISDWFGELPGKILDVLRVIKDAIADIGKKIIDWIVDGIKDAGGGILNAIKDNIPGAGVISGLLGDGPGRAGAGQVTGGKATSIVKSAMQGLPGLAITSTYRTPAQNRAVGGSPTSYHLDKNNPATDVGGPARSLDALYARLVHIPHRELLWRTSGHYDHLHFAHQGEFIGPGAPGWMPGLRSDERVRVVQTGETILPRSAGRVPVIVNIYGDVDSDERAWDVAHKVQDRLNMVVAGG